ncbi:uncharacterized protein LOC129802756 [Phlebotomus papatasi]|uniref:uncharacterized protein LOC129802756 n=1 Tax=Phlebotomus papatasi TaxID=29031 RepID=UPI0024834584|nr:uncharacterized protein LOC129802756 [Phlebotomus papatasi]
MKKSAQLTQEQLKNSLSSKQSKVKLKNVLANPYPKYWPLLPNNSIPAFTNILRNILSGNKSEDADKRLIINRNFMVYGLTEVHRSLKAGKVDSVIFSASIEPKFVVNQIIQLAFTKKKDVKVLCVEKLEDILKDVGITSTTLGLANQSGTNAFSPLHQFISEESDKIPIPELLLQDPPPEKEPEKKREKPKPLLSSDFDPKSLYLCKNSYSKERVYVPSGREKSPEVPQKKPSPIESEEEATSSTEQEAPENPGTSDTEAPLTMASSLTKLSISSKTIQKTKRKGSKKIQKTTYYPLIIKRIQPNPKRQEKKKLKKKK